MLREISAQTAESSAATTSSVAKLAELSAGLRKSIAGFRLPDAASGKTELLTDSVRTSAPATPVACRIAPCSEESQWGRKLMARIPELPALHEAV